MKNKVARMGITVLFAASLIVSMSAFAQAKEQHECSLARSAGNWSFTDNGTVIGVGPRTAVGVLTLDGKGNLLNGVATSSLNGTIADETFFGTYTVNPDCTGTVSAQIFASGTEILALTMNISFDCGMTELRGVFTSVTAPGCTVLPTVINLEARKQ
jgi:hypothetical protein